MKRLLLAFAFAALPLTAAHSAEMVMVRSAGKDAVTPYNKLTPQQKARVDQARTLLMRSPEDRPPASQRLRNHPVMRSAVSLQSSAQAKDTGIFCDYWEGEGVGCWIVGDDASAFCGIIWVEQWVGCVW
jgi:hypothetical protein